MVVKKKMISMAFFLLCLILLVVPIRGWTVETKKAPEPPKVIERIIKIEGTVEKPRVLFILSRARIWKEDPLKKSFFEDILKPVYPEALLKDFTKY